MSLLSENVIPDNRGKIFTTDAESESDLQNIKQHLLQLRGVDEVLIYPEKYPREVVVRTSLMVSVKKLEDQINHLGFHIIPKGIFAI